MINSDDTPTGAEISAQTALSTPADTELGTAGTVAASVVPTAAPSIPATVAPTTPATVAPTTPATIAAAPPVSIAMPAGSVVASDPAGWTMAVDPAWSDTSTNGVRTFFIQPAATSGDNVNVTTEALPPGVGIDAYVKAALSTIGGAAPDFVLAGQRRDSAVDGVQVELVAWSATLPGLPKLAFLQAIMVTPTTAYIATFTSPPETMPNIAPFVEPFLLTVRGT